MRDEALVEGAVADAVPDGHQGRRGRRPATSRATPSAAALDLSLADGRFAPDVLEVAARRAVTAWAEAVDGDDAQLRTIAHGQAAQDLLYPGDPSGRTRLVVRGPKVNQIRIVGLDAGAQPPTMTIEVDLEGRRYLEDRDTTAVLAGQPVARHEVHRALDVRARRRRPAAVAARRVGSAGPAGLAARARGA